MNLKLTAKTRMIVILTVLLLVAASISHQ